MSMVACQKTGIERLNRLTTRIDVVQQGVLVDGREDAERHADHHRDHRRQQRQLERHRQGIQDHVEWPGSGPASLRRDRR